MNDETRPELEIDEPCPKTWNELEGGGARRFCHQCSLHVVDGSAMTREAAEDLVRTSEGRVCMRLEVDSDGRPIHADAAAAEAHRERARRRILAWGLSAAAGVLSACDDARRPVEPAEPAGGDGAPTGPTSTDGPDAPGRPPEILGVVCYPEDGQTVEGGAAPVQHAPVEVLGEVHVAEPEPGGSPGDTATETPSEPPAERLGRVSIDGPRANGSARAELGKVHLGAPSEPGATGESGPATSSGVAPADPRGDGGN